MTYTTEVKHITLENLDDLTKVVFKTPTWVKCLLAILLIGALFGIADSIAKHEKNQTLAKQNEELHIEKEEMRLAILSSKPISKV